MALVRRDAGAPCTGAAVVSGILPLLMVGSMAFIGHRNTGGGGGSSSACLAEAMVFSTRHRTNSCRARTTRLFGTIGVAFDYSSSSPRSVVRHQCDIVRRPGVDNADRQQRGRWYFSATRRTRLLMTDDDEDNYKDDYGDRPTNSNGLDAMRSMLEASWNVESMGVVPTDPQKGAEAAATSITEAISNGRNILLIDILLPSYDITQGTNLYDEVLAVEYCVELANSLSSSSSLSSVRRPAVLIKNGKGRRSVQRILDAKDNRRRESEEEEEKERRRLAERNDDGGEGVEDDDDDDGGGDELSEGENEEEFDGGPTSKFVDDDVELFRQQLASSFFDDDSANEGGTTSSSSDNASLQQPPPPSPFPEPPTISPATTSGDEKMDTDMYQEQKQRVGSSYRLGTLFGDDPISTGPDMFDDVLSSLRENVSPHEDTDDALIVLSAYTSEEMIAIRRLVALYEDTKPIVLVNCKLDPMPRELIGAEMVYSLLPLIAKPAVPAQGNVLAEGVAEQRRREEEGQDPNVPPKVVVLRRYPRDWEVFVDVNDGKGFELVDSAPADDVPAKGPGMEWIAGRVKKYMEFKYGT